MKPPFTLMVSACGTVSLRACGKQHECVFSLAFHCILFVLWKNHTESKLSAGGGASENVGHTFMHRRGSRERCCDNAWNDEKGALSWYLGRLSLRGLLAPERDNAVNRPLLLVY